MAVIKPREIGSPPRLSTIGPTTAMVAELLITLDKTPVSKTATLLLRKGRFENTDCSPLKVMLAIHPAAPVFHTRGFEP